MTDKKDVERTRAERERDEEGDEAERLEKERAEKERPDAARARLAHKYLQVSVAAAKMQSDPLTWRNEGGPEAEDFLESIETGRSHPLLEQWEKRKIRHRHPPGLPEQRARIMVTSMCAALERLGRLKKQKVRKQEVRKRVAKALKAKALNLFPGGPPSHDTIKRWQLDPLTSENERFVANAIERSGSSCDNVVHYFIGLVHFVLNPLERARVIAGERGR